MRSQQNVDISYYAPGFWVEVNGSRLSAEISKIIKTLTVTMELSKPTNFRFDVQDEFKDERFEWLGNDLFKYGNNLIIHMGYTGNMHKMLEGKIQNISAKFFEGTAPSFTVDGTDNGYEFLNVESGPKVFTNKTDSDIAKKIADLANLKAEVDDTTTVFPTKTKNAGKSYFEFLSDLVESNPGYTFYLSEKVLYFVKGRKDKDSILTLKWGQDLISFNPTLDTREVVSEVIVRGWNSVTKEPIEVSAKAGEETTQEQGKQSASQIAQEIYGDIVKIIAGRPVSSVEEARQIAESELEKSSDSFIKGTADTIGIPELKPDVCITIEGLGEWFSGKYYVEKVVHTIDNNGYRSKFDVKRNAV